MDCYAPTGYSLRCPHCLNAFELLPAAPERGSTAELGPLGLPPRQQLPGPRELRSCDSCGQPFTLLEALPLDTASAAPLSAEQIATLGKPALGGVGIFIAILAAAAAFLVASLFNEGISGPTYLVFYAVVWVVLFITSWVCRLTYSDGFTIAVLAMIVFVALGAYRMYWGIDQGMVKWDYLSWMMMLGGGAFFIGVEDLTNRSNRYRHGRSGYYDNCSSWFSRWGGGGCGSGGGCGGGGGGCGGGCGGCGG